MRLAVVLWLSLAGAASGQVEEGMAALERNDLNTAQAKLEVASRLTPANARVWLLLAQTYARQKKREPALAAAQKAESLGSGEPAVLHGLAFFYAELERNPDKAASLEARYATRAPQDPTAWRRAASLYLAANAPGRAIEAASQGLQSDNSPEMHTVLGTAYQQLRQWDKAVAELRLALNGNLYDEQAHFRLAQAYLLQQDFASAAQVLQNARQYFDKSPQIELALGVADYGMRRFSEAVDQFLKTIRLAPDVPQPYAFLGRILEHAGARLPEVTQRFADFQARHPDDYLGYLLHAKALLAQLPPSGDAPQAAAALELLRKAVALNASDSEAHFQLGMLLERAGQYPEAAAQLEKSIALNTKDPAVHYRLARVYARLGRKDDAGRERAAAEKLSDEQGGAVAGSRQTGAPRP